MDVFPSENDLHSVQYGGRSPSEGNLIAWLKAIRPYLSFSGRNGVVRGPGGVIGGVGVQSVAGLTLTLQSGAVFLDGHRITVPPGETVTLIDNTWNHVYIVAARNPTTDIIESVTFQAIAVSDHDDFQFAPDNSLILGAYQCASGAVNVQQDWRRFSSEWSYGTYTGDGTPSRTIELGFVPQQVILIERGALRSVRHSPLWVPVLTAGAHDGLYLVEHTAGQPPWIGWSRELGDVPIPVSGVQDGFVVGTSGVTTIEAPRFGHTAPLTFPAQSIPNSFTIVDQDYTAADDPRLSDIKSEDIATVSIDEDPDLLLLASLYATVPSDGTVRVRLAFDRSNQTVGPFTIHIAWRRRVIAARSTNDSGTTYDWLAVA